MPVSPVFDEKEFNYKESLIMTQEEKTKIEERIVDVLKTVYDPEIPVNIYDLGMIYKIDVDGDGNLDMDMTFTSPACPLPTSSSRMYAQRWKAWKVSRLQTSTSFLSLHGIRV